MQGKDTQPNLTAVQRLRAEQRAGLLLGQQAIDTADRLISTLGEALNEIGLPPAGRLADGSTGSAQVCWMDAERCFQGGRYVAAADRARKGLAYLGLHTAAV